MTYTEKIKFPNCTLINVDCLEYLCQIPDQSIDLILTDPPYNIAQYSTGNIPLPGRSALNNDLGEWDLKEIDPFALMPEFKRILKPDGNIFIFTSYNLLGKWHAAFDPEFDTFQFFIWHKTNPVPKIYKNGFLNSCEMIICLWNKGHKWNFPLRIRCITSLKALFVCALNGCLTPSIRLKSRSHCWNISSKLHPMKEILCSIPLWALALLGLPH